MSSNKKQTSPTKSDIGSGDKRAKSEIPWKPAGKNSVVPYLIVKSSVDMVKFLEDVFGAKLVLEMKKESGVMRHAEVLIDDSIIMMGDAQPGWDPCPCHVHIYVPDVDTAFVKAVKAGGKVVEVPVKRDDPDKRGGVTDPSGIVTFWIGTQVEVPPS